VHALPESEVGEELDEVEPADGRLVDEVLPLVAAVQRALALEGSIGVIAADASVPALGAALSSAGMKAATADDVEASVRVTLLPASLAKGLEYDHVVVVEPADIVEAEARGLHRLYVVLTRAVSRLDVVHARPLPQALKQ